MFLAPVLELGTAVVMPQKRLWEISKLAGNYLKGRYRRGGNKGYDLMQNFDWKLTEHDGHEYIAEMFFSFFFFFTVLAILGPQDFGSGVCHFICSDAIINYYWPHLVAVAPCRGAGLLAHPNITLPYVCRTDTGLIVERVHH